MPPLEDVFLGLRRPPTGLATVVAMEVLDRLQGCRLIAHDDTFLGSISSDVAALDSVANPTGPHGSASAEASIFNPRGPYGRTSSVLSPFDRASLSPPHIVGPDGEMLACLSMNPALPDRIDPNTLLAWVASR